MCSAKPRGALLVIVLLSFIIMAPSLMRMAIIPGPEGLNLKFYGAQFGAYSNTLWKLGEISNNQVLEELYTSETSWIGGTGDTSLKIRCVFPSPSNTVFRKDISIEAAQWIWEAGATFYTTLQVERERPSVSEVNIHGDPLGEGLSPTQVRYIEYHTPRITEGNQISFTKYCIHVVPVDFTVQMSVRGDNSWGWEDTHLWFMLQTTVWRTAFTEGQVAQIQEWLDRDPPENATLSAYDYRGGFPIWAWIGEWDPLVWYDEEERETQPPQEALDNVRFSPSLEGREIDLYTEPSYQYSLDMEDESNVADPEKLESILIGKVAALPDPDFGTTVYFPMYLEKFYPYYETGPWFDPYRHEWYPTTYMRVRLMYAIYGEFNYLWTEEEADDQDYNWTTRSSQYKFSAGPWEFLHSLGSFLVSPSGILTTLMVLAAIVLIALLLINPALILGIFGLGKKGARRK